MGKKPARQSPRMKPDRLYYRWLQSPPGIVSPQRFVYSSTSIISNKEVHMRRLFPRLIVLSLFLLATSFAYAAELESKTFPLERNGVQLFLQRMQLNDDTPKGQILLVHGLTFSSHEFDLDYDDYSFARWLANNGYAVWMLDIAGYARSGEVKDGFMPDSDYAAEDINAAMDVISKESGQKQIDLLGWSWGTVTSSRFAAKYPEKTKKLILYAPMVAGLGASEVTEPFKKDAWKGASEDFQLGKDGKLDPAITDPKVDELFQANTKQYDSRPVPNGGRKDLLVSPKERLLPTARLVNPVLLIVGDKDEYVTEKLVREAAETIPGEKEVIVVRGGGHALFMEKPHYKNFRAQVLDFLKK